MSDYCDDFGDCDDDEALSELLDRIEREGIESEGSGTGVTKLWTVAGAGATAGFIGLEGFAREGGYGAIAVETVQHATAPTFARVPALPHTRLRTEIESLKPGAQAMRLHSLPDDRGDPVPGARIPGRTRFASPELTPGSDIPDTRTPLERFRTAPRKPLSVTDIVSPAWCELQYWYSLTKYGRKKRTPAMRQGSAVHKVLEEQVHTSVPVDVRTREDTWGLRIWNIIQSLRTLRVTGMTRELEVWGVVGGEVVNGIIDELSFNCTDPEVERKVQEAELKGKKETKLPPDQSPISSFFKSSSGSSQESGTKAGLRSKPEPTRKIYVTDVKTRGSATLPTGASLRPTIMQLMLYRRLLGDLVSNSVDADKIFQRYRLNPTDPFSDSLIAQLSALDFNFRDDATEDTFAPVESQVDTVVELLNHNSLIELWGLMIQEFQITMPRGADSLSKVLRAEFRSQREGTVMGVKTFVHSDAELARYVDDEMSWWKGERDTKGVEIEDAFKCRTCDFAEDCTWRINKVEDAVKNARARQKKG